jgi:hypothetical protein
MQTRFRELVLREINLPTPPIGNKILCVHKHGIYVLEKGPTIWRALANTHVGTGGVAVYDGVPDKNGFFNDVDIDEADPAYATSNGRLLFYANPSVMGMWMLDGGCLHGLTLITAGDCEAVAPFVTITWLPQPVPKQRIIVEDVSPRIKQTDERKQNKCSKER